MTVIVRSSVQTVVAPSGPPSTPGPAGGPGGNVMAIGLLTAAAGMTIPVGTNLVQTSGNESTGAGVAKYAADAAITSAYLASHPKSGFVDSAGRGFRVLSEEPFTPQKFYKATDSSYAQACQRALDYNEATAVTGSSNGYAFEQGMGAGRLFIPRPQNGLTKYSFDQSVDLFCTSIVEGECGHDLGAAVTVIEATGCSAFRVQRKNTSGDGTYDSVSHNGGDGSIFRNLWLEGDYSGTEAERHGIHAKARFKAENVIAHKFAGDAFHVVAFAGSAGALEGNANSWRLTDCVGHSCRNGLFLWGDNTNAGKSDGFNGAFNRQWGIYDRSFLSNKHCDFKLEANAQNGSVFATISGNVYYCVIGQETWCSTHAPSGTTASNQGWIYHAAGGVGAYGARAWTSGLTWRAGGPICTDNANAQHRLDGYVEGGQPAAMLEWPTLVVGHGFYNAMKHYGTTTDYDGYLLGGTAGQGGGVVAAGDFQSFGNLKAGGRLEIAGGVFGGVNGKAQAWADATNGLQILGKSGSSFDFIIHDGPGNQVARIPHGTFDWELVAGMLKLPANKGLIGANSAVPASGAHVVGEVVFNSAPAAGGKVGWVCVTAGTPGTWKPFGAIDA